MSKILSKDDLAKIFRPIKQYKTDKLIEILTELSDYVSEVEQQRADAVKKVEEFNKDEEIVKLKKQLEEKRERAKNKRKKKRGRIRISNPANGHRIREEIYRITSK